MDAEPAHEPTRILTSAGHGLPPDLRRQVLSGLRCIWPEGYSDAHGPRDWIARDEFHPAPVLLTRNGSCANAAMLWKRLAHVGETYTVFGLSIVFTFRDCRGRGYGRAVVEAATAHIRRSDADVATTLAHYLQALHRRDQAMLRWEHVFDSYDVLLCPRR